MSQIILIDRTHRDREGELRFATHLFLMNEGDSSDGEAVWLSPQPASRSGRWSLGRFLRQEVTRLFVEEFGVLCNPEALKRRLYKAARAGADSYFKEVEKTYCEITGNEDWEIRDSYFGEWAVERFVLP